MILVTGSSGLIGRALCKSLTARGIEVREFDLARSASENTCNPEAIAAALEGVEGVVHLAAVSRVVWAQRDAELTQATNVDALQTLLDAMAQRASKPWLIFASSREVYGEPSILPVAEDAALAPLNVYARSKVAGELLIEKAREAGFKASTVRFSNVYGCITDHADRVVPAFARTAAVGGALRLDGPENMFDFTHVDDVVRGLETHIDATRMGALLPPIHFVTGVGTTLHMLAKIAARTSSHSLDLKIAPPRNYDVAHFVGDPERARTLLGWQAMIDLPAGFNMLADAFRQEVQGLSAESGGTKGNRQFAVGK